MIWFLVLALAAPWNIVLRAQSEMRTQSEMVIQREGNTLYHRPACDEVRDKRDVLAMTRAQAEGRGLKAHADCDPAKNPPGQEGAAAKPAMVLIDVGGQYYHREKCEKLSSNTRRVPVTEAYKKHWPCRTCKPPIRPRPGKSDVASAGSRQNTSPRSSQRTPSFQG